MFRAPVRCAVFGAVSVSVHRYSPGIIADPVWHGIAEELSVLVVRRGELTVLTDAEVVTFEEQEGLVVDGGMPLALHTASGCEVLVIRIALDSVASERGGIQGAVLPLRSGVLLLPVAAYASALFMHPQATGPSAHYVEQLLRDMVRGIVASAESAVLHRRSDPIAERALTFVWERHADADLSPASVATAVNLSLRQLEREFAEHGTTIRQEIRRVRVEAAVALLTDPAYAELSVDQIARHVGVSNGSSLARAMAAEGLRSPAQVRAGRTPQGANVLSLPTARHTLHATLHTRRDRFPSSGRERPSSRVS